MGAFCRLGPIGEAMVGRRFLRTAVAARPRRPAGPERAAASRASGAGTLPNLMRQGAERSRRVARRSRRVARRRAVAALLLVGVVGAGIWAVAAHWPHTPTTGAPTGGGPSTSDGTSTSGSQAPASSTTTGPGDPTPVGAYAVASTSLALVEPPAGGLPARTLPTSIWYPHARGAAGSGPDRSGGPYPLLVFSQGYNTAVTTYATLLTDWASSGFVVAAPTYPHTDPDQAPTETDIVYHPQDLRYVIGQLVTRAAHPGWLLSGVVDTNAVGVVGQSDGGDVSLAVAADSQWRDPTVRAVAVLSGAENVLQFGGTYFTGPPVPILVVQSNTDTVNAPSCSVQVYDDAPQPKYYLGLLGPTTLPTKWQNHLYPYTQLAPYQTVIAGVTAAFFHGELNGDSGAAAAMAAAVNPSVAQLSAGTPLPTAPGTCPGA